MKQRVPKVHAKMADIAALAGVSSSTVSRALAGSALVAEERREEIARIAREHGYVVNPTARNLRLQRTQTISVVIPLAHETSQPLTDPFFAAILGHLADEITRRGYGVFLQKILPPMPDWMTRLISAHRSDGVIVIGQSTEHGVLEQAASVYHPLVVWGAEADAAYCTVGTDNVDGARQAVTHLIRLGRRRIVFVGDTTAPEIRRRYEGYRSALRRAKAGLEAQQVVPAHLTADAAQAAMARFIASKHEFDAVFAASDVIAISAISAIRAAGLRVPEDVAVVGFDDIAMAAHTHPALTTVRQQIQRGAVTLVDLVFRRIAAERTESVLLPAELMVRESCGAHLASGTRVVRAAMGRAR